MCGTGLVSYKFHDYIVPEVSIRASPESTVYMSLLSYFVNCFSMVHVYTGRSIGRASTEVKFTVFALPVFLQVLTRVCFCRRNLVPTSVPVFPSSVVSMATPSGGRWILPHTFHHTGLTCVCFVKATELCIRTGYRQVCRNGTSDIFVSAFITVHVRSRMSKGAVMAPADGSEDHIGWGALSTHLIWMWINKPDLQQ